MGAGSGEQVDGDFVNFVNRTDNVKLERIKEQGLSDQRKAFIEETLARRRAGERELSTREATRKFREARTVAEVRVTKEAQKFEAQGFTKRESIFLAQQSEERQQSFSKQQAERLLTEGGIRKAEEVEEKKAQGQQALRITAEQSRTRREVESTERDQGDARILTPILRAIQKAPSRFEEKRQARVRRTVREIFPEGTPQEIEKLLTKQEKGQTAIASATGTTLSIAPFLTPAAPTLLTVSGGEQLITKAGREEIKKTEQSLITEKGLSPGLAKGVAFGLPVAEVGLGTFGLKKQLTTPIVKALPKGKVKTTFLAKARPGKVTEEAFVITQKVPPQQAIRTTRLKQILGRKPTTITLKKGQTRLIKTVDPLRVSAKGEIIRPTLIAERRVGSRVTRLGELTGIQKTAKPGVVSRLGVVEKQLVKTPEVIGRGKTGIAAVELKKLGRVSLAERGKIKLTTAPLGKTIERAKVFGISKEAKTLSVGTGKLAVTRTVPKEVSERLIVSELVTRPVKSPFPRATAKVQKITGLTKIVPQKTSSDVSFIAKGTIQKTTPTISTKALKTLTEAKAVSTKLFPKVSTVKPSAISTKSLQTIKGVGVGIRTLSTTRLTSRTIPTPKAITKITPEVKITPTTKIKTSISEAIKPAAIERAKPITTQTAKVGLIPTLRNLLKPSTTTPRTFGTFPRLSLPKRPVSETPLLPGIPFFRTKKRKARRIRTPSPRIDDLAFAEGFTARAIGLKPIVVARADVPKIRIKPLGLRRGVIIR